MFSSLKIEIFPKTYFLSLLLFFPPLVILQNHIIATLTLILKKRGQDQKLGKSNGIVKINTYLLWYEKMQEQESGESNGTVKIKWQSFSNG